MTAHVLSRRGTSVLELVLRTRVRRLGDADFLETQIDTTSTADSTSDICEILALSIIDAEPLLVPELPKIWNVPSSIHALN